MTDIVIVNWNSGGLLKKCIDSILFTANTDLVNKIFIIDNHSSDHSLAHISVGGKTELIQNSANLGFAKACNQGFKSCTAKYILLLNPDTQLKENTIADCFNFMEHNKNVDILGCQLLDDNGSVTPSCARFPTPWRFFIDATGLPKIAPRIFTPAILMTDWDHLQGRYVDQVIGAFMFMPAGIFRKLGYFDERFFVYYEELDFSLRLSKANGKTFYNPDIRAIHTGMGTTEAVKGYRLYLNLKSRLQYARKNFSGMGYALVCFSTVGIEFFSRLFFLSISGRFKEIKDLVRGYRLLIGNSFERGYGHRQ